MCVIAFADEFHIFGLVWTKDELYTYVDTDSNRVLHIKFDESYWTKNGWDKTKFNNPWKGRPNAAPFDQEVSQSVSEWVVWSWGRVNSRSDLTSRWLLGCWVVWLLA